MRILADENFPKEAVEALLTQGHDVVWVRTDFPGAPDVEVIRRAASEKRVLLTFDKDFGYLAFRARLGQGSGIVLFRTSHRSPSDVAERTVALLGSRQDWEGHFAVIEDDRLRMTPLPGGK